MPSNEDGQSWNAQTNGGPLRSSRRSARRRLDAILAAADPALAAGGADTRSGAFSRLREDLLAWADSLVSDERPFQVAADFLPVVVCEFDRNFRVRYVNQAGMELYGINADDIAAGLYVKDVVHPDDLPKARKRVGEILRMHTPVTVQYRTRTRTGVERVVVARSAPVVQAGKAVGILTCLTDVTERLAIEQALRESEAKFRLISEQSMLGLEIMRDGRIVYANRAAGEIFGISPEELMALPPYAFLDRIHPDDRATIEANVANDLHREGGERSYTFRVYDGKGQERVVGVHARQVEYEGAPAVLGSLYDLTERIRWEQVHAAQRDLAVALSRTSDLDEAAGKIMDTICQLPEVDACSVFLFESGGQVARMLCERGAAPEFVEMTREFRRGDPEGALLFTDHTKYVHCAEFPGRARLAYEKFGFRAMGVLPVRDGESVVGILNVVSTQLDAFSMATRHLAESLASRVGGVFTRLRMAQALRESERRYRGLVESQHDMVVRVDRAGRFTYVNESYCRTFGQCEAELLGSSFQPLVHPDDLAATLKAMEALSVPPYRVRMEQRAKTVDGWRWLEWEDCAIRDEAGQVVEIQAVGRDITGRKRAERDLLDAHRKLMTAREEERRRLARELHDSVGQKTVALQLMVKGLYEKLAEHGVEAPPGPNPAEFAGELVRDMRAICHGLFPPTLESFGLEGALKELAGYCQAAGLAVDVECPAELVRRRPEQPTEIALFRIAQEALTNAMRHGGARHARIRLSDGDDLLRMAVEDDGMGFDTGEARGQGLGLTTMRERARAVGGTLEVTSCPGRTIVQATVPL